MAINKVIYSGDVLMDITDTTAEASTVLSGAYFYGRDGVRKQGSCTYDSDTSDATAAASNIISAKTAYVNGVKVTGTMANNGGVTGTISTKSGSYSIPVGYHDGSGKVSIASSEAERIIPGNIKQGITLLGVSGSYTGEECISQSKTVTPTKDGFTVQPDAGYTHLSSVVVSKVPYVESANTYGTTVTIL